MTIYLLTFMISISLFYISRVERFKKYRRIFDFIAILIPCIVAGLRAPYIGTDIKIYVIPIYEDALKSNNLFLFLKQQSLLQNKDYAFVALNYLISRFFSDYHWALFFYELITISFIYFGMKRSEQIFNTPLWLGMLLYYFALYNSSLNIMRQCIAVSILFFGVTYLFEKKYINYFISLFVAFFFHSSAIFGCIFLPMYWMLEQKNNLNQKKKLAHSFIILIVGLFMIILGPKLIKLLVEIGVLRVYYLEYLPGGVFSTLGNGKMMNPLTFCPELFYILLLVINYKKLNELKLEGLFFLFVSIAMLVIDFGPLYASFITRIGYYIIPLQCISLANICHCYTKKMKIGYVIGIVFVFLVVWIVTIGILKYSETVPYMFFWNEI